MIRSFIEQTLDTGLHISKSFFFVFFLHPAIKETYAIYRTSHVSEHLRSINHNVNPGSITPGPLDCFIAELSFFDSKSSLPGGNTASQSTGVY